MGQKERFYVDIMALQEEVTGSCNLVVVKYPNGETTRFIVDCGLFQEREYQKYNCDFPFDGENIEFAIITHNHVDHVGRLPLLIKKGFNGKIYATYPTKTFMPLALFDSYKVLKDLAKRNHEKELYSEANVSEALKKTVGCMYNEPIQLNENIKFTFFMNGHLIGAAIVLLQISYPGYDDINILFTGDYSNKNIFLDIVDPPEWIWNLPLTVVQESTYGDMDSSQIVYSLENNILECVSRKKTTVCMVFSLGRCQEVLYFLKKLQDEGKLSTEIPIYLDGKLAIQYTSIYKNADIGIKEEMQDFLPANLTFVSKDTRPLLLEDDACKIILTTSGMGTYGPAQIYIPNYIEKEGCLLQFTGYTAEGTLGRRLKDTPKGETVTISGVLKLKLADVAYTNEMSAHAKADDLIDFLKKYKNLKFVLVTHGENLTEQIYAARVAKEVTPKDVAILEREYFFRINAYGLVRSLSTSYR